MARERDLTVTGVDGTAVVTITGLDADVVVDQVVAAIERAEGVSVRESS